VRFATYLDPGDGAERVGVVEGDEVFALPRETTLVAELTGGLEALLASGSRALADRSGGSPLAGVVLRAPLPVPPSIRDFLAFEEHLRNARGGQDIDPDWYELPIFYFSNPAAVHGPGDDVAISPGSAMFDFELEVAAVVGARGADLTPQDAERHIAGYTVMCDFSARDLQRREMRLGLGPAKGKDGATSLGPWLVTRDELEPYRSRRAFRLEMVASVNGRRYGGGNLDDLYWSFAEMLSYASRGTEVVPGDVIGSGTVGTGCILELAMGASGGDYPWLSPGDLVELSVEHLGTLRHRIGAAAPVQELRPGSA